MDQPIDDQLIQTREVLDEVISSARSLYEELRHDPKVSASVRKRLLGLFSSATIKMLGRVEQLQESDKVLAKLNTKAPTHIMTNAHLRDFLAAQEVQA